MLPIQLVREAGLVMDIIGWAVLLVKLSVITWLLVRVLPGHSFLSLRWYCPLSQESSLCLMVWLFFLLIILLLTVWLLPFFVHDSGIILFIKNLWLNPLTHVRILAVLHLILLILSRVHDSLFLEEHPSIVINFLFDGWLHHAELFGQPLVVVSWIGPSGVGIMALILTVVSVLACLLSWLAWSLEWLLVPVRVSWLRSTPLSVFFRRWGDGQRNPSFGISPHSTSFILGLIWLTLTHRLLVLHSIILCLELLLHIGVVWIILICCILLFARPFLSSLPLFPFWLPSSWIHSNLLIHYVLSKVSITTCNSASIPVHLFRVRWAWVWHRYVLPPWIRRLYWWIFWYMLVACVSEAALWIEWCFINLTALRLLWYLL